MSKKKGDQIQFQLEVQNEQEWQELLKKPGLWVIDVFRNWSGPCVCAQNTLKKLKLDLHDDMLNFAVAACDNIQALSPFRFTCEPQWLFLAGGEMVGIMKGADVSLLSRMVLQELEKEKNVVAGKMTRSIITNLDEILTPSKLDFGNPAEEEEERDMGIKMLRAVAKVHFTAKELTTRQFTLALIKPDAVQSGSVPDILQLLKEKHIDVLYQQERILTKEEVSTMYEHLKYEGFFSSLVQFMTGGPSVVLVLARQPEHGSSVITEWKELLGPSDATDAKSNVPTSLRAIFGHEGFSNALHGSDDEDHATNELNYFLPKLGEELQRQKQFELDETTFEYCVLVVRPSTYQKLTKDLILEMIQKENIEIISKTRLSFNADLAEQLHSNFRRAEQEAYVQATMGGTSFALVVSCDDIFKRMTMLLGPENLKDARSKFPNSWRAKFTPADQTISGFYNSQSMDDAFRDLVLLFPHLGAEFMKLEKQRMSKSIIDQAKMNVPLQFAIILVLPHTLRRYRNKTLIKTVMDNKMTVFCDKITCLANEMASEFFADYLDKPEYQQIMESVLSGPSLILCVIAEDILAHMKEALGPISVSDAKHFTPASLRSLFSDLNDEISPMYSSESEIAATIHLKLFFPEIADQVINICKGNIPRYIVVIVSAITLNKFSKEKVEDAILKDFPPFLCEKMLMLTRPQAEHLYQAYEKVDTHANTVESAITNENWIIALYSINCLAKLKASIANGSMSSMKDSDVIAFRMSIDNKAALEEMDAIFPTEVTFGIIKPDSYPENAEKIKQLIVDFGMHIISESAVQLPANQVGDFYKELADEPFFPDLIKYMTSGKVLLMAIRGHNAIRGWRKLMGPTDPDVARKVAPFSIRALYGKNIMANAVHGSNAPEEATTKMKSMAGAELFLATEPENIQLVYTVHVDNGGFCISLDFLFWLKKLKGSKFNKRRTNKEMSYDDFFYNFTTTRRFRSVIKGMSHIIAPVQVFLNKNDSSKTGRSMETSPRKRGQTKDTEATTTSEGFPLKESSPVKELATVSPVPQSPQVSNHDIDNLFPAVPELNGFYRSIPEDNGAYRRKKCFMRNRQEYPNVCKIFDMQRKQTFSSSEHESKKKESVKKKTSTEVKKLKKEKNRLQEALLQNITEIEKLEGRAHNLKCKLIARFPRHQSDSKLYSSSRSKYLHSSHVHSVRKAEPTSPRSDTTTKSEAPKVCSKSMQLLLRYRDHMSKKERKPEKKSTTEQDAKIYEVKECQTDASLVEVSSSDVLDEACFDKLKEEIGQTLVIIQEHALSNSEESKLIIAQLQQELVDTIYDTIILTKLGVDPTYLRDSIRELVVPKNDDAANGEDVGCETPEDVVEEKRSVKDVIDFGRLVSDYCLNRNTSIMSRLSLGLSMKSEETLQIESTENVASEFLSDDESPKPITRHSNSLSETSVQHICSGSIDPILEAVVNMLKKTFEEDQKP